MVRRWPVRFMAYVELFCCSGLTLRTWHVFLILSTHLWSILYSSNIVLQTNLFCVTLCYRQISSVLHCVTDKSLLCYIVLQTNLFCVTLCYRQISSVLHCVTDKSLLCYIVLQTNLFCPIDLCPCSKLASCASNCCASNCCILSCKYKVLLEIVIERG